MIGNQIELNDIKPYEIKIAKCGAVCLVWIASPGEYGTYEIRRYNQNIYSTNLLLEEMKKYNELVK